MRHGVQRMLHSKPRVGRVLSSGVRCMQVEKLYLSLRWQVAERLVQAGAMRYILDLINLCVRKLNKVERGR